MIVVAYFLDVANLEDSPVHFAVEAVTQFLCHVAQMQVIVRDFAQVHVFAEIGVCRVRSTILDGLCVSQVAVGRLSGAGTCEDAYLELASGLVFSHCNLG